MITENTIHIWGSGIEMIAIMKCMQGKNRYGKKARCGRDLMQNWQTQG